MPSRLVIVTIVIFWLGCTAWMFVREVLPRFRAGDPPLFFTDVTAEMGGSTANWNILYKGKNVGVGFSQVRRPGKRTYEFSSDMKFENFRVLGVKLRRLQSSYVVNMDGSLRGLKAVVKVGEELAAIRKDGWPLNDQGNEPKCEVTGKVVDGKLRMSASICLPLVDCFNRDFDPVDVSQHRSVLNTMHLIDKVPGLWEGRTWQVPLFNPLKGVNPLDGVLPGAKMTIPLLIAEVHADELEWQRLDVPCFRIDYAEPGKKVSARTWVRRADSLVLQQEASHGDLDLVLVREVIK